MNRSSSANSDSVARFLRLSVFAIKRRPGFTVTSCELFTTLSANTLLGHSYRYRTYSDGFVKSSRSGLFTWCAIGLELWSVSWNGRTLKT
jgi:hypothetical protein